MIAQPGIATPGEPGTYWGAPTRGSVQDAMAIDFFPEASSNATLTTTFEVTA